MRRVSTMLRRVLLLMCATLVARCAAAQDPISTARPRLTENVLAIDRGYFQIETGISYDRLFEDVDAKRGPELLVRFGVLPRTELRVGYDHAWVSSDGDGENIGTFQIGGKVQLTKPGAEWGLALIPAAAWAEVESAVIDNESADRIMSLTLAWARAMNAGWSIGGVVKPVWLERESETETAVLLSLAASRQLDERSSAFAEWAADFPEGDGEAAHVLHGGMTYLMSTNAQLDIHAGFGLTDAAPDWTIGFGLGYRAPK
jgi:Putative MetA-pathway of phenol degradation